MAQRVFKVGLLAVSRCVVHILTARLLGSVGEKAKIAKVYLEHRFFCLRLFSHPKIRFRCEVRDSVHNR